MLEQLKYVNHLGEELVFGRDGFYVNENELYNVLWQVDSVNDKISGFSRGTQTRYLPVRIACSSQADGMQKRNKLFEIPERDVLSMQYGRLFVNGYYCECFIVESKKTRYAISERYMEAELSITTDRPAWIKETELQVLRDNEWESSEGTGLEFPFGFMFDLGKTVYRKVILNNPSFFDSNFRMEISGKAVNPTVYINDHEYQVNTIINDDETLVIDSGRQKIYTVDRYGTRTNAFDARGRDDYIFQPIASGDMTVRWDNSFDMSIYLLEERSEPKWRKFVQ